MSYYEFALLNGSRIVIRNFYLKESFSCYQSIHRDDALTISDLGQVIDILLRLNLAGQAAEILTAVKERNPGVEEFSEMDAKIAFSKRDYRGVIAAMAKWTGDPDLTSFWCGDK